MRAVAARAGREVDPGAVCRRVLGIPEFGSAACVALFASLPAEIPTRPLFEAARQARKRCLLPRTVAPGELAFAEVACWEDLRRGRYGVREPIGGDEVPLAEAGVVVVPGVAFDSTDGRLGRGGGYYDRALAGLDRTTCLVVGVTFSGCVVDEVPRADWDEPVDVVVTEREVLRGWSR